MAYQNIVSTGSVYKGRTGMWLYLFHRITGVALTLGTVLVVLWITTLSLGESFYEYYVFFIQSRFGNLILIGFTFAFFYHLSNGIRHLFWDFGYGYELNIALISGVAVLISAFILTSIIWGIILF